MRTIVGFGMALLLTIALSALAPAAAAGDATHALEEANAALAAQPPQREAVRRALERAAAAEDKGAASQAYYRLGILDEEDQEFERALAHYRQSIAAKAANTDGHWARNASHRTQWLAGNSEGNFAPLARLSRFKRDPALSADPDAVAAFDRDTEAFPPGKVRAEARTIVGAALAGPLHRPRDAVPVFRRVTADPSSDAMNVVVAERALVDALLADGQLEAAAKEIETHAIQLDPEVVTRVKQLYRRRTLLRGAELALAAFVGFAAAMLVYACWKRGSLRGALRSTRTYARVGGALWCAASMIVATFVLLGAFAPTYLDRIGL